MLKTNLPPGPKPEPKTYVAGFIRGLNPCSKRLEFRNMFETLPYLCTIIYNENLNENLNENIALYSQNML